MKNNIGNISRLLARARVWGVPDHVLIKIVYRDKTCIYCHGKMKRYLHTIGNPKDKATIEHFSNVAKPGESVDVGICCSSCNASKSDHKLSYWFKTKYCVERDINKKTVARPVKDYIRKMGKRA